MSLMSNVWQPMMPGNPNAMPNRISGLPPKKPTGPPAPQNYNMMPGNRPITPMPPPMAQPKQPPNYNPAVGSQLQSRVTPEMLAALIAKLQNNSQGTL